MPSSPPHADATPRDHEAARALLQRCFPDAGRLVPFGAGDFCLAFRDGTRVVRVARHAEAADALRREACVLAEAAGRLPLPVPRPTYHAPADGPAFSVHEEVRGEVLTRERWLTLPAAARERAARELAAFLDALHALPTGIGARCDVPRIAPTHGAAELHERAAELRPRLSGPTWNRLDRLLARCAASPEDAGGDAVLLHCDIAPGHLLFDPADGRLTGIIDFGDLATGDPARDFIYVHEDFGPEILAAVLRHYRREDAGTLLPRVHLHYLLETVAWTVEACAKGEDEDVRHGIAEITRELETVARGPGG